MEATQSLILPQTISWSHCLLLVSPPPFDVLLSLSHPSYSVYPTFYRILWWVKLACGNLKLFSTAFEIGVSISISPDVFLWLNLHPTPPTPSIQPKILRKPWAPQTDIFWDHSQKAGFLRPRMVIYIFPFYHILFPKPSEITSIFHISNTIYHLTESSFHL